MQSGVRWKHTLSIQTCKAATGAPPGSGGRAPLRSTRRIRQWATQGAEDPCAGHTLELIRASALHISTLVGALSDTFVRG